MKTKESEPVLVTRAYMPPMEEYIEEIRPLWDSHWITNMGEKHLEFQSRLKEYLRVQEIELFTNGHMALELSMQSLDLKGEVITTPFTFASTTHAIVRNGLKPVFCDIDPENYTIDAEQIEGLITDRTSAIVPVHVYGNICDVEAISDIAKRHGLKVLYDAAHAVGETYKGIGVGNFGDISCFSFHATKVFHTIEGGAASFHDTSIGKKLYDLKNFGIHGPEHVTGIGANAKMNEFCASMGLCNLRHLEENIQSRKSLASVYQERLSDIRGITYHTVQPEVESNYAYFPIIVNEEEYGYSRDDICSWLEKKNIYPRKYFYPLTNEFECYEGRFDVTETPIALSLSRRVLTLPIYMGLEEEVVQKICTIIREKGK